MTAFLGKLGENRSIFILDSIGPLFRDDLYSTVGRHYTGYAGAPGAVIAGFAKASRAEIAKHFNKADWFNPPSLDEFMRGAYAWPVKRDTRSMKAIDGGDYCRCRRPSWMLMVAMC